MADPMFSLNGGWSGMISPGNLDLLSRPSVPNPSGGTSSVFSMSIGVDGKEYLIPRVSEDGKMMNEKEAIRRFYDTNKYLGVFDSPENATAYASALHQQQAELGRRRSGLPQSVASHNQPFMLEYLIGN